MNLTVFENCKNKFIEYKYIFVDEVAFYRWNCFQATKDVIWFNFMKWLSILCFLNTDKQIEKKFVAEANIRRQTLKCLRNTCITKNFSIMHLVDIAMVPRLFWRGEIFHCLLKWLKIVDLLYNHYLFFYSLQWEGIFCCSANRIIFSQT